MDQLNVVIEEVVQILDDVVCVANFEDLIKADGESKFLNGTYIPQLSNQSIVIRNHTYSGSSHENPSLTTIAC